MVILLYLITIITIDFTTFSGTSNIGNFWLYMLAFLAGGVLSSSRYLDMIPV